MSEQTKECSVNGGISRLQIRRRQILTALIANRMMGETLDDEMFNRFVGVVRSAARLPMQATDALRATLIRFNSAELTHSTADMTAMLVAGSHAQLKRGEPLLVNAGLPPEGVWAPLEIKEMRFDAVRKGRLFCRMTALVMTGPLVGQEVKQSLPARYLQAISREFGFKRFTRPVHTEFVGMWFCGHLAYDKRGSVVFDEFEVLPHQKTFNKKLTARRDEPCARNSQRQCKTCPIGYSDCSRATHRYTWVKRKCSKCKSDKALFDPSEADEQVCLSCRARGARTHWAAERRSL